VRETIAPTARDDRLYVIVDTTNSREGVLHNSRSAALISTVGSNKKVTRPGDVIISRLRPYLRQVALVDNRLPGLTTDNLVACSTEYFVLRSLNGESIAYLVPLLLSPQVQEVLAAAQEGGHHPRVSDETVLNLPLPAEMAAQRAVISDRVEQAISMYRTSEAEIVATIGVATSSFAGSAKLNLIAS